MEKGNSKLKPWVKDITNHFFHSAENCHGDEMLLKVIEKSFWKTGTL